MWFFSCFEFWRSDWGKFDLFAGKFEFEIFRGV